MMQLERRALLGTLAGVASVIAGRADACSLVARRQVKAFSESAAQRSLRDLVTLIKAAPTLSEEALATRSERAAIRFDSEVSDDLLDHPQRQVWSPEVIRAWMLSEGRPDRTPIRLTDVNLLNERKGVALYQFTLERERYRRPRTEEEDGCGDQPGGYTREERAYLGVFINNALREVKAFPDWLRTLN